MVPGERLEPKSPYGQRILSLDKVGSDLHLLARPLLHLFGYLPLANFDPRTGCRPTLSGADERVWHHGWDKANASVPVVLDNYDPVSLDAWRVCYALHDTRPYFEVYESD